MREFLEATKYVDFGDPAVARKAAELFQVGMTDAAAAEAAFLFVRDEIPHSFDIGADKITASASDALKCATGICHAKANLLAALLRARGIPAGFCYQRLTLADDDSKGYCLHCFNAVYLGGKWIKLDARGNTNGKDARFSMGEPVLAFPNRPEYDEYFFDGIYAMPDQPTMKMLERARTLADVLAGLPGAPSGKPDIVEEKT